MMILQKISILQRAASLPVLLFLIILFQAPARAQVIKGVGIAGFNATQVDGDEVFGFHKYGWNLGASAIIPLKNRWMIGLENIYNQKGSYQRVLYPDSARNGSYRLQLDYVEVPVLLLYDDKAGMTFGSGFSWGRLINIKEYEHGKRVETTTLNGPYNRNDWNFLFDIRFRVYKRFKFNFRYAYSMVKIRTRSYSNYYQGTWDRKQYNNLLTFRLLYYFNEKPPIVIKKKKK